MKTFDVLICGCSSLEHQIIVRYDNDNDTVYCGIHLKRIGFWKRLIHAVRYVFGYKSKYGDFEEFILKKEHAHQLLNIINHLNLSDDMETYKCESN